MSQSGRNGSLATERGLGLHKRINTFSRGDMLCLNPRRPTKSRIHRPGPMGTVRPRPMQVATRGRVGQRLGDSFVRIRPLYGIIDVEVSPPLPITRWPDLECV